MALPPLVLAACGGGSGNVAQPEANVANAAGAGDVQARIRELPEGQRNAALIRAIRDARLDCQHVVQSSEVSPPPSTPAYVATCEGGGVFLVVIEGVNARVQQVNGTQAR
jgi:hypothetical protein